MQKGKRIQLETDATRRIAGKLTVGVTLQRPLLNNKISCYSLLTGVGMEMNCAPGTVYNPDNGICDWYNNVADCLQVSYHYL